MNWDAIGAIGEILGAAAVVVTLLYLARETKKNAQALDATSAREVAFRLSEWHRLWAQDSELKRILRKSVQPEMEDYSESEWLEFRALAISVFLIYETHFLHLNLSLGSREVSENYIQAARGVIDSFPAYRRFWEEEASSGTFTQGFIEAVNAADRAPNLDFVAQPKIP